MAVAVTVLVGSSVRRAALRVRSAVAVSLASCALADAVSVASRALSDADADIDELPAIVSLRADADRVVVCSTVTVRRSWDSDALPVAVGNGVGDIRSAVPDFPLALGVHVAVRFLAFRRTRSPTALSLRACSSAVAVAVPRSAVPLLEADDDGVHVPETGDDGLRLRRRRSLEAD